MCVCGHQQASISGNKKTVLSGEEKGGLILTDCHRKIPVQLTFFSFNSPCFSMFSFIFSKK